MQLATEFRGLLAFASLVLVAACPAVAWAEVQSSAAQGFRIQLTETTPATPQRVYDAIVGEIGQWWSSDHTFSGDAANLYFEAKPGGIFGERLAEGGFVRHLEVVFLQPHKRIGLSGGLGPLQELGVQGTLTILLDVVEGQTRIRWNYHVTGYLADGLDKLAPIVDRVLGEQLSRLVAHLK